MKLLYTQITSKLLILFLLFGGFTVKAQDNSYILNAYKDYSAAAREVVYLHLNKSTYIKGESIGFTAYVLDKKDKKPSLLTTNLYVTIVDKAQNIVKQKLIMVNNGIASNTFEVDSLFSAGNYQIKAYTNWMLNFKEQNYFIESIKIKDQNIEEKVEKPILPDSIDAQFLPESGHLLHGIENNVGVIIKDSNGYGIPFVVGNVMDKNNNVLTTFKTNKLGIGRFVLIPDVNNSYKINISYTDKELHFSLNQNIEKIGVILSAKRLKDKLYISAITNTNTLNLIKNKRYSLMLHNGNTFNLMDLYFIDNTTITKIVKLDSNSPGISVFTLFNEMHQPIAERLVFNYQGISILESENKKVVTKTKDSLTISLSYKNIDPLQFHNISVSVLPKETKSYQRAHNLISYTYLQPYLKSNVENGKYYFTEVDEKKRFELDNLLITQGWSSYNWKTIFNNSPSLSHIFEQGIKVKANITSKDFNNTSENHRLIYYLNDFGFTVSEIKKEDKNHIIEQLYPRESNTLKLSEITTKGDLKPAELYLQFFPSKIPLFNQKKADLLDVKTTNLEETEDNYEYGNIIFENKDNIQKLDEVILTSNPYLKKLEKRNELSAGRFGKISVVYEQDERIYGTLWNYLRSKAYFILGNPQKYNSNGPINNSNSLNETESKRPNIFLDDMQLMSLDILNTINLSDIEFIEINRFGIGGGMTSPGGFIKIYTKDPSIKTQSKKTANSYNFPLTFSESQTFYVPKYRYYNDDFYKHYGTIDWKPQLVKDSSGNISFKIEKPEIPITIFLEGITYDGSFIFEEKTMTIN